MAANAALIRRCLSEIAYLLPMHESAAVVQTALASLSFLVLLGTALISGCLLASAANPQ